MTAPYRPASTVSTPRIIRCFQEMPFSVNNFSTDSGRVVDAATINTTVAAVSSLSGVGSTRNFSCHKSCTRVSQASFLHFLSLGIVSDAYSALTYVPRVLAHFCVLLLQSQCSIRTKYNIPITRQPGDSLGRPINEIASLACLGQG
jgi:hypothetical protein